jgi:pimeloyl-ACP methyl ester carboxylesterase
MHTPRLITALLVAATLVACADSTDTSAPSAPNRAVTGPSASAALTWAVNEEGVTGEGAQYGLYAPASWNGDLVVYAHGIKDIADPIALPTPSIGALRDALGSLGYAVAYSSFSENGWAVKDGIQHTHKLRGLFNSRVSRPQRTFVIGHSMGGLVATALAETYPQQYDGALPMCGVLGGAQREVDYIANVRTLFDFFYPGALPGNALDMPASLNLNTQVLGPAQAAILSNVPAAFAMASVTQTPLPFANAPELIQSILTALAFGARGADDFLDRTHGHSPFGNASTVYTGPLPPPLLAALNASVMRFEETPDAANYLEKYYNPTGDLRIPTITLHTTRDPVVPFFHETVYAATVAAAGQSSMLLQRSINRYGHCTFTGPEMIGAFQALVGWVTTGVRPAS